MSKFGGFITLCVGVATGYSIKKYSPRVKRVVAEKLSKWILGPSYQYYQPLYPYTPYWSYPYYSSKDTFNFEDLYHARQACQEITDILDRYKKVRLSDVYEIVGYKGYSYLTPQNWGWTDLTGMVIYSENNKWIVKMPMIEHLDGKEDDEDDTSGSMDSEGDNEMEDDNEMDREEESDE